MPKPFLSSSSAEQSNLFVHCDQFRLTHPQNPEKHYNPWIPNWIRTISQNQDRVENPVTRPVRCHWSKFAFHKLFAFRQSSHQHNSPSVRGDQPHTAYSSVVCASPSKRRSQIPILPGNRSTVVRKVHQHSKLSREQSQPLYSPCPQTEPACCLSFGGFFNGTKSQTLCNFKCSPRSMFTTIWCHTPNTVRRVNQRIKKTWTRRNTHAPDRVVDAFLGSRLDLDQLCPESNAPNPGLFSPESLENLIFEMLEKRAESAFGLPTKGTSCVEKSFYVAADKYKVYGGRSSAHSIQTETSFEYDRSSPFIIHSP